MNKLTIIIISSLMIFSCKKAEEISTDLENDKMMAQDNQLAESSSDDASIMADEAYNYGGLKTKASSGGSSILGDTVKIKKNGADSSITIDFGTTGILCKDGKTRKGMIKFTFANGFWKKDASVTQTFDNYYVSGVNNLDFNKIEGTRSIIYKGLNSNQKPFWAITSNLTIIKSTGKIITWISNRVRTMVAGFGNSGWGNNEYEISGSANGSTSLGDTYSIVIGAPLYIKVSCKYIQSGTITYTRNTKTISIDYGYGSGTCDNQALLTYANGTAVITL